MKKFLNLMFVVVLTLAMSITAFAAPEKGSITINGVSDGTTYEIYKLLDLESYNSDTGVYSYKVNSEWTTFFKEKEGASYFTIDDQDYATWYAAEDDDTVAAFAKAALAYAKANSIAPVKTSKTAGQFVITGTTGKFADLDLESHRAQRHRADEAPPRRRRHHRSHRCGRYPRQHHRIQAPDRRWIRCLGRQLAKRNRVKHHHIMKHT